MATLRSFQARLVRVSVFLLPLLAAAPALAVTDRRAVRGAVRGVATEIGPAIPEPTSILLFALGVGIVGYGVHRRRRSR